MKILFIHPQDFFNVIGCNEAYYVFKFLSKKHEVELFSCSLSKRGILKKMPRFLTFNILSLVYLPQFIYKKYDLIYSYKPTVILPVVLKLFKKCKWVCDLQTDPIAQSIIFRKKSTLIAICIRYFYKVKEISYRKMLQFCDLVIVVSSALERRLIQKLQLNSSKCYIQSLGVDTKLFQTKIKERKDFIITYVSSIALYRGFQVCLKAAAILIKRKIPFKLLFIGSAQRKKDGEALKLLTRQMGISEHIEWVGFIPHNELPQLLDKCCIGLSPLPDIEAYRVSSPTKVFEYMSMELGVVASNIEAHHALIKNEENGLLFNPDDPVDLADKIQLLYEQRSLCERLGNNARSSVLAYDWESQLGKLQDQLVKLSRGLN